MSMAGEIVHVGETSAKNTESELSERNIALYQGSTILNYHGYLLS